MGKSLPFDLMDDPRDLAEFKVWDEGIYRDFSAFRAGTLTEEKIRAKYQTRSTILCLDMTGFTESAIRFGELESFLRICDVQKVCGPIFKEFQATLIRAFADDLVALFNEPEQALDAAFEVHRRIQVFNQSEFSGKHPAEASIGLGYGDVFAIGPNKAMGDEMNRASKLGEDTARANETLLTNNMFQAVKNHPKTRFEKQNKDDLPFPFYAAFPR